MRTKRNLQSMKRRKFKAKIRMLGASNITTIPIHIVRELNLKTGDKVILQIEKDENDP